MSLYNIYLQLQSGINPSNQEDHQYIDRYVVLPFSGVQQQIPLIHKSWSSIVHSVRWDKTSNVSHILAGSEIGDHSDVVGASLIGAAPTTSSFSTWHLASGDSAKTATRQKENPRFGEAYIRDLTVPTLMPYCQDFTHSPSFDEIRPMTSPRQTRYWCKQ